MILIQWEYKIIYRELDGNQLNELGLDEWELCGVKEVSNSHEYFFKRRRRIG